ncbi:MAG: hypothetical protein GF344_04060 [Chitinivibrionales bacterium]|nr:hypothetical protein [Chitinivibrionales bacterium]
MSVLGCLDVTHLLSFETHFCGGDAVRLGGAIEEINSLRINDFPWGILDVIKSKKRQYEIVEILLGHAKNMIPANHWPGIMNLHEALIWIESNFDRKLTIADIAAVQNVQFSHLWNIQKVP